MPRFPYSVFFVLAVGLPIISQGAAGQPPTSLQIQGGAVQLDVDAMSATPGEPLPPVTDNSTTLRYSEREDGSVKIMVATTVPEQLYELRVQAQDVGEGVPQGEIPLIDGMPPADLIRGIDLCDAPGGPPGGGPPGGGPPGGGGPSCREGATLRYRVLVDAEDGPGSDSHTVEYTILAQ